MSLLEQEIFKSIQTIAKRIYDKNSAGYDRTIKGVVVSIPQKNEEPEELFIEEDYDEYDDESLNEDEYDDEIIEDEYTNTFSNEYNNGFYIVRNGEARYQAKYNGNEKIKVGDSVFVLIPQGNPSNTKYILGLV